MNRDQKEFYDEYKNSLKKNIVEPKERLREMMKQQQQFANQWKTMSASAKIEYLASIVVKQDNALRELGPLIGLILQALGKEGILESVSENTANGVVTHWRIKNAGNSIKIRRKGENERTL